MSTQLTAEQTLLRHCQAFVDGDFDLARSDLTPEGAASLARLGLKASANVKRYELVGYEQHDDTHYFTVTYIGDSQFTLRTAWHNVGGVWKITSVAIP